MDNRGLFSQQLLASRGQKLCLDRFLAYLSVIVIALSLALGVEEISVRAQTPPASESETENPANSLETDDSKAEADKLFETGLEQFRAGQFEAALETYKRVLAIREQLGDKPGVGQTLNNMGDIYSDRGQYQQALEVLQQALALRRELRDRAGTSETLNSIGFVYRRQREYSQALELHEEALEQAQTASDRSGIGESLHNIGAVYGSQGQVDRSLDFYERALLIREEVGDRRNIGRTLNNMGTAYFNLGNYSKALETYQQALEIRREIGDNAGVARLLNNIAFLYRQQGDDSQALSYFEQAISMLETIADNRSLGRIYNVIAELYQKQEQDAKALVAYEKAFQSAQKAEDKTAIITALDYLANAYYNAGDFVKARLAYEQALAIYQEDENSAQEGTILASLGRVYHVLGDDRQAQQILLKALLINKEEAEAAIVAFTLNNLGTVYNSLGQYSIGLNYYKQALNQLPNGDDTEATAVAYNGMGEALFQLRQYPLALENFELALAGFQDGGDRRILGKIYNRIGNVLETLERENLAIAFHKQSLIVEELENPQLYRNLASLLLQENRLAEAQQVVDIIRIKELKNYLGDLGEVEANAVAVKLLPGEAEVLESASENILNLRIEEGDLRGTNLEEFNSLQENLRQFPGSVLLYPLILEDRLELILVKPNGLPIRRTVDVSGEEIERAIANYRLVVATRIGNVERSAEQLYEWLIEPIENDLREANAETILYAPDRQLHYIPLGGLYDGRQWLVEQFNINNIAAASLTDFETKPRDRLRVLAAAFTAGDYNLQVGREQILLRALTGQLVESLAEIIPETRILLNEEFNLEAVIGNMSDRNILHLDTPVALVTGEDGNNQPEDSLILFGDGELITLRDMETWSLPNVDLVVLSAAETNIGVGMGNGEEIVGLGYQMQRAGVKSTLTSLWRVDEDAVAEFMRIFYTVLQEGKSQSQALREAQIAIITGDEEYGNSPYYWASFVLMGNW